MPTHKPSHGKQTCHHSRALTFALVNYQLGRLSPKDAGIDAISGKCFHGAQLRRMDIVLGNGGSTLHPGRCWRSVLLMYERRHGVLLIASSPPIEKRELAIGQ
ncbi:MAG: hypothetical protein CL912_19390 [Deltaproteobacteria bacterium]|nr:hypothetical protein [Deltaproteobacteria bacterium]